MYWLKECTHRKCIRVHVHICTYACMCTCTCAYLHDTYINTDLYTWLLVSKDTSCNSMIACCMCHCARVCLSGYMYIHTHTHSHSFLGGDAGGGLIDQHLLQQIQQHRVGNDLFEFPHLNVHHNIETKYPIQYICIANNSIYVYTHKYIYVYTRTCNICVNKFNSAKSGMQRGGGLGSRPIFKKFNEPYAPS